MKEQKTTKNASKPDKKDNQKGLLRSGLGSEYYLLSFAKPERPYEIAKTIKNVKTFPDVSKMYPARNRLIENGYLRKEGTKYYPIYSKLAQEITDLLEYEKNVQLNQKDVTLLQYFLRNSKFLRLLHDDVIEMIQREET